MTRFGASGIVVLLTLAGCVTGEQGEESESEGPGGSDASATTDEAQTSSTAPTTSGTTGEVAGECSVWTQDCPPGAKCVPFDSTGTGVVDGTRCVEIANPAGKAGDPCSAEGGIVGLDDCDAGLLCWLLDADGLGTCTPMCGGTPASPTCEGGLVCDVSTGGLLPLCLTTCNPLAPTCPIGQICIPSMSIGFVCDGNVSGDAGFYGDPCEFLNVCDPGLLCAAATNVPGCDAPGCCTEFCDLSLAQSMPGMCSGAPDQECLPFFDQGTAPPGLEDVGLCGIKQ
ncbi:ribulose phosphate epimerase [Nannocystis pusilla]|uniref:ribulose phosphate epimerase n=1 Tax=Nannocystis pusilla TaxID=889268 RepID=UPI003DA23B9B